MQERDLLTVDEVAEHLGCSPRQVRSMISSGRLRGLKAGARWLVHRSELEASQGIGHSRGRPLSPSRCWALLGLMAGREPDWLTPHELSRTRSYARTQPLEGLVRKLRPRARLHVYRAHPSDVPRLDAEERLVLSGASAAAAYDADLRVPDSIEAYVRADDLPRLERKYRLSSSANPNVRLHVVDGLWPFGVRERVAAAPVVAVDLIEAGDERSQRAGWALLEGEARP